MARAWQARELGLPWEVMEVAEVEVPEPGPGQIRIRVEAADVNFADILQCQGQYQVRLDPPFTPGMSAGGVVDAVGEGVSSPAIGQRAIGMTIGGDGGFAEYAVMGAEHAVVVPDGVSTATAVAGHVIYGTSWFALHRRGNLQPGETVLVLAAAGGVGSAAVQMAKAHGCRVLAAAGGEAKVEVCRELGADVVIDYRSEDLRERVLAETDGQGVDVVYDPVGGEHFDVARRLLAWEGRLLVVGFASGDIPSAPANHVLVKNYSVVGVHMGAYREVAPAVLDECFAEIYPMMADGRLEPLVSQTVGFHDLPQAMLDLYERRTTGRVIFDPSA